VKRRRFLRRIRDVAAERLVFLDESGANTSMLRSHAWVLKGHELVTGRPMNWGTNLTMIGAMRLDGWITMSTFFKTANRERFVAWIARTLAPKLRRDDVVIMDNAQAHHDPRVLKLVEKAGARVEFLPPYSPDLNPIEPGWALVKKVIKATAPRDRLSLRRAAHAGRRTVRQRHCAAWFGHSGYGPD
jgi:transposase